MSRAASKARGPGRPRGPTLTRDDVVRAAVSAVERDGPAALGIHEVARALGIRAASLYNHIRGAEELNTLVAAHGYAELLAALTRASANETAPRKRLRAFARGYRAFALANANLYAATTRSPLEDGPEKEALNHALFALVGPPLQALGVSEGDLVHALRTIRSALFGFVALELAGEFELRQPADESFEFLVRRLLRSLGTRLASPGREGTRD